MYYVFTTDEIKQLRKILNDKIQGPYYGVTFDSNGRINGVTEVLRHHQGSMTKSDWMARLKKQELRNRFRTIKNPD